MTYFYATFKGFGPRFSGIPEQGHTYLAGPVIDVQTDDNLSYRVKGYWILDSLEYVDADAVAIRINDATIPWFDDDLYYIEPVETDEAEAYIAMLTLGN